MINGDAETETRRETQTVEYRLNPGWFRIDLLNTAVDKRRLNR